MRILFLPQKSILTAGSRVRVYQFLNYLNETKVEYNFIPGSTEKLDNKIVQSPTVLTKLQWFLYTYYSRIIALFRIRKFDVVFLQRESLPNVFPLVEILILKISKRVVFDFDDAIFTTHRPQGILKKIIFDPKNIQRIIKRSDRIIVSNNYLAQYASKFNKDITLIPSCIELNEFENTGGERELNLKPVVGWIGGPSTHQYLKMLYPVFERLSNELEFNLKIVGVENVAIKNVSLICKRWDMNSYVNDIQSFDIGVMPLPDDEWTKGKAGYKLLQYMAAGIPSVASPVGVNCEIIQDGINGFLAANEDEWVEKLQNLLTSEKLRKRIGEQGKNSIKEKYSYEYNFPTWFKAITQFD